MNVTEDTLKHIDLVRSKLCFVAHEIYNRAMYHDASKLEPPEREMFEMWRPKLDSMDIESDEYKNALAQMGDGLKHHYSANRHHPEHFENGVGGMNLIDVIEMVCDWDAAAQRKGDRVNMRWASKRFGISESENLYKIIKNTLDLLEQELE